jgi:multicomponent Na+:H+ antiporter subunit B
MIGQHVLRTVVKLVIPWILLFALYVQFHGDYGPGGGFQAGVIVATAFILYSLIFGERTAMRAIPPPLVERLTAVGVTIYAGVGVVTLLLGGKFLDYDELAPHHPSHGQHWGILLVELGVGITVAAVITTIFFAFLSRARA